MESVRGAFCSRGKLWTTRRSSGDRVSFSCLSLPAAAMSALTSGRTISLFTLRWHQLASQHSCISFRTDLDLAPRAESFCHSCIFLVPTAFWVIRVLRYFLWVSFRFIGTHFSALTVSAGLVGVPLCAKLFYLGFKLLRWPRWAIHSEPGDSPSCLSLLSRRRDGRNGSDREEDVFDVCVNVRVCLFSMDEGKRCMREKSTVFLGSELANRGLEDPSMIKLQRPV